MQFKSVEQYILLLCSNEPWAKQIKVNGQWVKDPSGAQERKTKYLFTDVLSQSKRIEFIVREETARLEKFKGKPVYLLVTVGEWGGKLKSPALDNLEPAGK